MKNLLYGFIVTTALGANAIATNVLAAENPEDSVSPDAGVASDDIKALVKAVREQSARLARQEKKLDEQSRELEKQRHELAQERAQFERLRSQLAGKPAASTKTVAEARKPVNVPIPDEVGIDRKESKEKMPEIPAVIEQGGVLTAAGKMVVTPALEYVHSSATSVEITGLSVVPALNIGLFDVSKVNRDILTPSLDFRYGLTNRLELEGKVPYVYRKDSTLGRPVGAPGANDTLTSVSGHDIGDVEFAAHYQVNNARDGWPYLVANLRFKTATGTSPFEVPVVNGLEQKLPTGSGFYAIQPSLTGIYPTDPLVYYANLGYLHNFSRKFGNYGDIDPGDGISGSLGMSLALNDKSSLSLGYSHTTVFKTMQNGRTIPNSTMLQVGTIDLGFSYNLTDTTNLNFTVSAGVTSDAPDVRLIFRVPMTF